MAFDLYVVMSCALGAMAPYGLAFACNGAERLGRDAPLTDRERALVVLGRSTGFVPPPPSPKHLLWPPAWYRYGLKYRLWLRGLDRP